MYDYLAESVRLIEHGVPDQPERLSRRRRFQPIAVDVDGDIAIAEFLYRAHGGAQWDSHVLARENGNWRVLGGGGGGGYPYDELLRTPVCESWEGHARCDSGGGSYWGGGRAGQEWIAHATLKVCEHVHAVTVGRTGRHATIPWNRRVAVVWPGRTAIQANLLDGAGIKLQTITLAV